MRYCKSTSNALYISVFQWQILVCTSDIYIAMCQYSWQEESHTTRWGTQEYSSQSVCQLHEDSHSICQLHKRNILSPYCLTSQRGSCRCMWPETSHSQISHPHPGSSWPFFSFFTLYHTPVPTLAQHQNTRPLPAQLTPRPFGIKNTLTNIPPEKKKARWNDPPCLFECEERAPSLSLTSSVYICQVPNLINYQLRTLGDQQLVDKKLVLSTVGW